MSEPCTHHGLYDASSGPPKCAPLPNLKFHTNWGNKPIALGATFPTPPPPPDTEEGLQAPPFPTNLLFSTSPGTQRVLLWDALCGSVWLVAAYGSSVRLC